MINIDIFTLGNEFKADNGETYAVISNLSEGDRIIVEFKKISNEPLQELIKES